MALNERIGPSSRERLTTLAKSIGREEFAMNVLEIPSDKVLDDLADQLAELYDMRSLNEVTRYSGFLKNPPEPTPDSEPFNPTGAVAEFREDLRALFGKFKDELNNRKFIGGVAEVMVNWKSLLRSQLKEALNVSRDKLNQLAMNIGFEEFAKTILMLRDENLLDDIVDAMKMYQDGNTSYYNPDVLKEKEVEEMSTSAGAGSYLTKYAFKLPKKQKKLPEGTCGYDTDAKSGKKLKTPGGLKENVGATLGPGPKAGPDGVKDNYYVTKFKYKLVPKDKNGNYVQKGSGLEVKNF